MALFAGTSIHWTQCTCIPASSICNMPQESSSEQGSSFCFLLCNEPFHNKQLIIIYCHNIIVNVERGQVTHFFSTSTWAFWTYLAFSSKDSSSQWGVPSLQMILFIFPLCLAIVLRQAQVSITIFFEHRVDSIFDIILVVLAVIVSLIFVTVFVYLVDILITMITTINYCIILLELMHNNRTSSLINITKQCQQTTTHITRLHPGVAAQH